MIIMPEPVPDDRRVVMTALVTPPPHSTHGVAVSIRSVGRTLKSADVTVTYYQSDGYSVCSSAVATRSTGIRERPHRFGVRGSRECRVQTHE